MVHIQSVTSENAAKYWRQISALPGDVPPGAKILDVGTGIGHFVRYLREKGYDAIGIDRELQPEAVKCERSKLPIVVGDAYRLPFQDGSFDLVTSVALLPSLLVEEYSFVTPTERGCRMAAEISKEIRRVVRHGGYWVLLDDPLCRYASIPHIGWQANLDPLDVEVSLSFGLFAPSKMALQAVTQVTPSSQQPSVPQG